MSDDDIQITVDGQPLTAKRGQMLIEVTDAAGIDVPRFCYHRKLSVAANCRMCLVEVEKAPKPLPACATPVMPDMIVHTQSKLAREAQQGTMEFLLINHPLDCPICDQGGECELQDVAMGYGSSASQYTEGKRVVMDKYIGPLIATEMTRCIHCTRCVRFGEEIAGIRELGATGRGEDVRIGTYIEKSVVSEVSGNVIDICPVGALTARPSRYTARSWELRQAPSVSPHDSVGSNVFVHLDGERVNRVIPRDNESVNEVWIADRDRFSYQGIASEQRVTTPMHRVEGELVACDWPTALASAGKALKGDGQSLGVLASASATLEELYLTQKLARALGCANIDHRLGQSDFSAQDSAPVMPWLGMAFNELENLNGALLVGSNIRKDQPIAALRLRKAALSGAAISFINPRQFALHFEAYESLAPRFDHMVDDLIGVAIAAGSDLGALKDCPSVTPSDAHKRIAESLKNGEKTSVMLGNLAVLHPAYAQLQLVAARLAEATNSILAMLPERANTAGAWLAGVVPHREAGGAASNTKGKIASEMLSGEVKRLLLINVEPELDAADSAQAITSMAKADSVVSLSSFWCDSLKDHADVVLPIATFTETYGTFVNATGTWQSSAGLTPPKGDSRPGWKVLRVLAETLELTGFGFDSPEDIGRELQHQCANVELNNLTDFSNGVSYAKAANGGLMRAGETPIYATDPLVRRSEPLQKSADGKQAFAFMAAIEVRNLGVADGDVVTVKQNGASVSLPVKQDDSIPEGCVWVPNGLPETAGLGGLYAPVEVSKS
ncbi:MAG: NADH-quinone oxidoreductase subunit NuoG [Gammaproteobacteria bacterium]|nr:NADH-quinone oxidoreductase subunit NuoG [Gammaproteobacteria bacterium]